MAQAGSTSITRRSAVAGLTVVAALVGAMLGTGAAYAQSKESAPEKSLYERLGGVFAIAAVVDHFSDAIVKNPIVGQKSKNPQLREWHTNNLKRLPGLKSMRTLWVAEVSGGPYKYVPTKAGSTPLGLEEAHRNLKITPAEFAGLLRRIADDTIGDEWDEFECVQLRDKRLEDIRRRAFPFCGRPGKVDKDALYALATESEALPILAD